jgi:fluoroquinolone resistance protein
MLTFGSLTTYADNYNINPETNTLKKAKFSLEGVKGLLGEYDLVIEG